MPAAERRCGFGAYQADEKLSCGIESGVAKPYEETRYKNSGEPSEIEVIDSGCVVLQHGIGRSLDYESHCSNGPDDVTQDAENLGERLDNAARAEFEGGSPAASRSAPMVRNTSPPMHRYSPKWNGNDQYQSGLLSSYRARMKRISGTMNLYWAI